MNDVNNIAICKNDCSSKEEFENAIKKAVTCLLDNNYIMTVRYDEKGLGIVSIDFEYDNLEYGCCYPYWLSPEEYDEVYFYRQWKEESKKKEEYENDGN